MNSGKYIFSQIVSLINEYEFSKCVNRYKGDYRTRDLTCWSLFLQLFFGQLTSLNSLRDISLCLKAHKGKLYHLGIGHYVNSSFLSRANENRDWRIFADFGQYLITLVRPFYQTTKIPDITVDNAVFAIDSTTISLSIKLFTWAFGKYSKGAIKMHLALDLRGSIPTFIHITDGKYHDSNVLDIMTYQATAIYIMDKAYVDFKALYKLANAEAFFVTRAKKTMKYEVVSSVEVTNLSEGIIEDQTVLLTGRKSKRLYPKPIRRVLYWDKKSEIFLEFMSNNFDISAMEIANLYKNRWQIETFFKWIKQNLTIKRLWVHSENAVRIHLWVAISTYLIVAYCKKQTRSDLSIYEIIQILGISVFDKSNISDLLTESQINRNVKEQPSLFD